MVFCPPGFDLEVVVPLLVLLDYEGFDFVVFLWIMAGKHLVRCQRRSGAPLVSPLLSV